MRDGREPRAGTVENEKPVPARFPRWLYANGEEPDPRFTLANERTFLAWVRTALAILATAVAVLALDLPVRQVFQYTSGVLFACAAIGAAVWSWWAWARSEHHLRLRRPLPGLGAGALLVVVVAAGAVTLVAGLLVGPT